MSINEWKIAINLGKKKWHYEGVGENKKDPRIVFPLLNLETQMGWPGKRGCIEQRVGCMKLIL